MTRLRHPNLLEVIEPLMEDRNKIAFVTESLFGSLADFMDLREKQLSGEHEFSLQPLNQLEVQLGIRQLAGALEFLHSPSVQLCHTQLSPENVYVNSRGDWKLSGLGWSNAISHATLAAYPSHLWRPCRRQLDYTAPEIVFEHTVSPMADIFSLGCLLFTLYSPSSALLLGSKDHLQNYKRSVDTIVYSKAHNLIDFDTDSKQPVEHSHIPATLYPLWRRMLYSAQPQQRPSPIDILSFGALNVHEINTVCSLQDSQLLLGRDQNRDQLFKDLLVMQQANVFSRFSIRHKLLPVLLAHWESGMENILELVGREQADSALVIEVCVKLLASMNTSNSLKALFDGVEACWTKITNLHNLHRLTNERLLPSLLPLLSQPTQPNTVKQRLDNSIVHRTLGLIRQSVQYTVAETVIETLLPTLLQTFSSSSNLLARVLCTQCIAQVLEKRQDIAGARTMAFISNRLIPALRSSLHRNRDMDMAIAILYRNLGLSKEFGGKTMLVDCIVPDLWKLAVGDTIALLEDYKMIRGYIDELSAHLDALQEKNLVAPPPR